MRKGGGKRRPWGKCAACGKLGWGAWEANASGERCHPECIRAYGKAFGRAGAPVVEGGKRAND